MRKARSTALVLVTLVAALLAGPSAVLAADPAAVTGTVVRDGAPVTNVEVVVAVSGSDVIASGSTDENGAFSITLEVEVGSGVEVFATGRTSRSDPDREGCVTSETPVGDLTATIEALPPAPLVVELDTVLTSTVCTATGTPNAKPGVTPPSTDLVLAGPSSGAGGGLLLALGMLALAGAGAVALRPTRR